MNTSIVKLAPQGDFENISIEMPTWKSRFQSLIDQRKGIKYQVNEMPSISKEIQDQLNRQNYVDLILESDPWQHFLVPR